MSLSKHFDLRRALTVFATPTVIGVIGVAFLVLAKTQPAWVDGRIGPGLFAQLLSTSVIGLSIVWAALVTFELYLFRRGRTPAADTPQPARLDGKIVPGLTLLSSVLLFILTMPTTGLAVACALTAAVAGWGAGDRTIRAMLLSAVIAGALSATVGSTLLPPTTKVWPWSPF